MRNGYNKTIIQELKSLKFPAKLSMIRVLILVFSFIVFYGFGWLCGGIFVLIGDAHPGANDEAMNKIWEYKEREASESWSLTWGLASAYILLLIFKLRDKRKKKL